MNCSKGTTIAETVKIRGVEEETRRTAGINLTGGITNATEIMCSVLDAPTFNMLLEDFQENELTTIDR